jgi:hypothetical protein
MDRRGSQGSSGQGRVQRGSTAKRRKREEVEASDRREIPSHRTSQGVAGKVKKGSVSKADEDCQGSLALPRILELQQKRKTLEQPRRVCL